PHPAPPPIPSTTLFRSTVHPPVHAAADACGRRGETELKRIPMSTHRRRLPAPLKWGLLLSLVAGTALAQRPVPTGPAAALPSLAPLVESVGAAVVNVDVRAKSKAPQLPPGLQGMPFGDLFGMPSPGPQQQPEQLRTGQGSGFIVDAAGLILTNHHVVADAVTIRVRLPDGRSFNAKVLGSDPLTDLALLQ